MLAFSLTNFIYNTQGSRQSVCDNTNVIMSRRTREKNFGQKICIIALQGHHRVTCMKSSFRRNHTCFRETLFFLEIPQSPSYKTSDDHCSRSTVDSLESQQSMSCSHHFVFFSSSRYAQYYSCNFIRTHPKPAQLLGGTR